MKYFTCFAPEGFRLNTPLWFNIFIFIEGGIAEALLLWRKEELATKGEDTERMRRK